MIPELELGASQTLTPQILFTVVIKQHNIEAAAQHLTSKALWLHISLMSCIKNSFNTFNVNHNLEKKIAQNTTVAKLLPQHWNKCVFHLAFTCVTIRFNMNLCSFKNFLARGIFSKIYKWSRFMIYNALIWMNLEFKYETKIN